MAKRRTEQKEQKYTVRVQYFDTDEYDLSPDDIEHIYSAEEYDPETFEPVQEEEEEDIREKYARLRRQMQGKFVDESSLRHMWPKYQGAYIDQKHIWHVVRELEKFEKILGDMAYTAEQLYEHLYTRGIAEARALRYAQNIMRLVRINAAALPAIAVTRAMLDTLHMLPDVVASLSFASANLVRQQEQLWHIFYTVDSIYARYVPEYTSYVEIQRRKKRKKEQAKEKKQYRR